MAGDEKSALAARLAQMVPPPTPRPSHVPAGLYGFHDHLAERRRSVVADTYAERLTIEDLTELVRFFESDVGQAFLRTWPVFGEKMQGVYQSINTAVNERPAPSTFTLATATDVTGTPEFAKWVEQIKQDISK
jgi:hypothetical protein